MTTLREAAQQALDALERYQVKRQDFDRFADEITALRAALAEQQCPCGDRLADQCPGEWEPGCDLGANEKYAKVAEQAQPVAWLWQHEDTGHTGFVDSWQLENGWQQLNPRLQVVAPLYTTTPAPQPLTIERLRYALVASRIIEPAAVEDPDDYDDGVTLARIEALYRRIT
jgi:hypothetical protein